MADPYDDDSDEDTLPNVPALRQAFSRAVLTGTDPSAPTGDYSGIEDRRIAGARHEMNWANTFVNTPPSEVLRARRDYVGLVNQAVERKQQLMAQTDIRAMKLYQKGAEFEEWQRQAPLRDATMIAELDKKRYDADKDLITANQTSSMLKAIKEIQAPPGTKEHMTAALEIAAAHPYALTTEVGKQVFKDHSALHDIAAQLQVAKAAADASGMTVTGAGTTATGGVTIDTKPAEQVADEKFKELRGITKEQASNPVKAEVGDLVTDKAGDTHWEGNPKGPLVRVHTGTSKGKVAIPKEEYLSAGGKLGKESLTFNSEEEAEASGLPKGTEIIIKDKKGKDRKARID